MYKTSILSLFAFLLATLPARSQQTFQLLRDIRPGAASSTNNNVPPVVLGNTAYFTADATGGGSTLWRTDGTPAGTTEAVSRGVASGINSLQVVGNQLFFMASPDSIGVFAYKGTGAAVRLRSFGYVGDILPAGGLPDGKFVFAARRQTEGPYQLWVTDGTTAGTSLLGNTVVARDFTYSLYKGQLVGQPTTSKTDMFPPIITDGTTAGTRTVKTFLGTNFPLTDIRQAVGTGDRLFLRGPDQRNFLSTYVTDGTTVGTWELSDDPLLARILVSGDLYYIFHTNKLSVYNIKTRKFTDLSSKVSVGSDALLHQGKVYLHTSNASSDGLLSVTDGVTVKVLSTDKAGDFNFAPKLHARGDTIYYPVNTSSDIRFNYVNTVTGSGGLFAVVHPATRLVLEGRLTDFKGRLLLKQHDAASGYEMRISAQTVSTSAPVVASLSLAPNPASDWLQFSGFSAVGGELAIIVNAYGQVVGQMTLSAGQSSVEVAHLPAGWYVLTLRNQKGRWAGRFLKQ